MPPLELVLLSTVKNVIEMPPSEEKHDATLTTLIRGVSRDFENISGRGVNSIARSEVLDVEAFTKRLKLKGYPVSSIIPGTDFKVFHDSLRAWGTETELDVADYYLDAETGIVDLFKRFTPAKKVIKVTYTGGMAVMTSPATGFEFWNLYPDIAEAVIYEVIREFKSKDNLGAAAIKIADQSTTIFKQESRMKLFKRLASEAGRASA